ncbi:hypothetical protein ES703_39122 [subsurface metagenome]
MNAINTDKVNLFVLNKHHLTDETKTDNIIRIVGDIGGLHATGSTTPYLSLFTRTNNFIKDVLEEEIHIIRRLGKIRCMRKTLHILTKEMIPIAYAATKKFVELNSERYAQYLGISKEEYKKYSKLILKVLNDQGMTASEIRKAIKTKLNVSPIINLMCDQGLLIRGISRKGWKSNLHTYFSFKRYFPDINLYKLKEKEAVKLLVKQYLSSFGPVTEDDITWWTGLGKTIIKQSLKEFGEKILIINISNLKGNFILLKTDERNLKGINLTIISTINFLPVQDPYIMGYKERERYINPGDYDNVFDRSGNATATILLDGRVIGVWDFTEKAESIVKIYLFKKVGKALLKRIYSEASRIGEFMANKEVKIKECNSIVPLTQRTAGGFMSPLKGC